MRWKIIASRNRKGVGIGKVRKICGLRQLVALRQIETGVIMYELVQSIGCAGIVVGLKCMRRQLKMQKKKKEVRICNAVG